MHVAASCQPSRRRRARRLIKMLPCSAERIRQVILSCISIKPLFKIQLGKLFAKGGGEEGRRSGREKRRQGVTRRVQRGRRRDVCSGASDDQLHSRLKGAGARLCAPMIVAVSNCSLPLTRRSAANSACYCLLKRRDAKTKTLCVLSPSCERKVRATPDR